MNKVRLYRMLSRFFIAIFIFGILFRILHWPFGLIMLITSLIGIAISSFLFYSAKLEKSFIDKLAIVLIPVWCVGYLLQITHAPFQLQIRVVLLLIALFYFGYQTFKHYRNREFKGRNAAILQLIVQVLGFSLIIIGLILKLLYWPYASFFLWSGLVSTLVYFMLIMFLKEDN